MNSSESAEAIVKMSLEGAEVVAKIAGTGAEKIAVLLYAMAKGKKKTKGKTRLNNLLTSQSPLKIFSLRESELKEFHKEAKKYGVLYVALKEKKKGKSKDKKNENQNRIVDIMVKADDATKVNYIVEKFNLSMVDIASIKTEVEKDKQKESEQKSETEKIVDDIFSKPSKNGENKNINPEQATTEKSPLSELSSENKNNLGVTSKKKKFSVRETLKNIKNEIKAREMSQKESLVESKEDVSIDANKKKAIKDVNAKKGLKKAAKCKKERRDR